MRTKKTPAPTTPAKWTLQADDVTVWTGATYPTQEQIDRAARGACARGWNGTQLDLYKDGADIGTANPSLDVFE